MGWSHNPYARSSHPGMHLLIKKGDEKINLCIFGDKIRKGVYKGDAMGFGPVLSFRSQANDTEFFFFDAWQMKGINH